METIELGPLGRRYRMIDPGGGGRVAKILRSGVPYEVDVVEDMAALGVSGVAVDVGANIGNHTLWLAMVCGLQVVAFEPIKYAKLEANLALNDLGSSRVSVHRVALGAVETTASASRKNRLTTGAGTIPVRRLDDFDLRGVSILKIDVEGMEADVIAGGLVMIERERPTVYAEAWDRDYRDRVDWLLSPLGYRRGRRFRWHQNRWDPPEPGQ